MARLVHAASPAVLSGLGIASALLLAFLLGRAWLKRDRKGKEREAADARYAALGSSQEILNHFNEACAAVEASPDVLTETTRLKFYGLYKQATQGDCTREEPSPFEAVAHSKWSSWKANRGMSRDAARKLYIQLAVSMKLLEIKSQENTSRGSGLGPVHSKLLNSELQETRSKSKGDDFCCLATEGNYEAMKKALEEDPSLVAATGDGRMTALHFAADRGYANIVKLLLEYGADLNYVDDCGETPLHVAIAADQAEVVSLLIAAGAETCIKNNDGFSCADLLVEEEIKHGK